MGADNSNLRERIAQRDVTTMRSYLEVDFAYWLSENEIPYGYEPFTIPSVVGPSKDDWDSMVDAIRALGDGDEEMYNMMSEDTPWERLSAFEARTIWGNIYDKHRLGAEDVFVPSQEALSGFNKRLMLPDFVLYPDYDGKMAGEDFDWDGWDKILEVSGLWGVGLPGESIESDWWEWYRVSAVAFKEYVYRLLGLWDDVIYAVPNQPYIEGISDGIPNQLRDDDNYVIFNTTAAEPDLDELYVKLGLSSRDISEFDNRLSPAIEPVMYERDLDGQEVTPRSYGYEGLNMDNADENENAVIIQDGWIAFHGGMGTVYLNGESVHVRESQWRHTNMIMLREYIADSLSELYDDGIVENFGEA